MENNRVKTDSIFMDLMMNAFDFGIDEIGFEEFLSAHEFYYSWYHSWNFEDFSPLNFILAFKFDRLVHGYLNGTSKSAEDKETFRRFVGEFVEKVYDCQ